MSPRRGSKPGHTDRLVFSRKVTLTLTCISGNVVLLVVWQNSWFRSLSLCGEYKNTGLYRGQICPQSTEIVYFILAEYTLSYVQSCLQLANEQWPWIACEFRVLLGLTEDETPLHSFLTNFESKSDEIFDCLFCHQRVIERWFSIVRSNGWNIFCPFPCSPVE
jgi:hypothetical protein